MPTPSGSGLVKSTLNPLLAEGEPGSWMTLKADPVVIKDGDTYKMWFSGVGDPEDDRVKIGHATSENGIDWDILPDPVFTPKPGAWDQGGVETAFVLKDGDTYKLWYSGWTTFDVDELIAAAQEGKNLLPGIGYATSKDGIHWERYGDGPVIGQQPILWHGVWDEWTSFADPYVIKEDGVYKMWFHGNGQQYIHEIGYATSEDGINWELHPDNPIFRVGTKESFESRWVVEPTVIKRGDIYEMWYGASPTKEFDGSIEGLKTMKGYIGHATSEDGIRWTRDPNNPILGPGESGSGSWEEDGAIMPAAILDDGKVKIWYVGIGRQGTWYPELTRGFQYQIGYMEQNTFD